MKGEIGEESYVKGILLKADILIFSFPNSASLTIPTILLFVSLMTWEMQTG